MSDFTRDYSVLPNKPVTKSISEGLSKSGFIKYAMVFLLMAFSGVVQFIQNTTLNLMLQMAIVFISFYLVKKIDKFLVFWVIYLFVIFLFQKFGMYEDITLLQFARRTLITILPYFVLVFVKKDFERVYLNILFFIAIYTTVIYLLTLFIPPFDKIVFNFANELHPYDVENQKALSGGIYTYVREGSSGWYFFTRNAGIFWEPGAYAMFLIFGIVINYYKNGSLTNKHGVMFIIALITTQSTGGYLSFYVLLVIVLFSKKKILPKFLIGLSLVVFVIMGLTTPFISEKLESEVIALDYNVGYGIDGVGRFYKAKKTFYNVMDAPISGKGFISHSREDFTAEEVGGFSILEIGERFGVLAFIFYIYFSIIGIKRRTAIYNVVKPSVTVFLLIPVFLSLSSTAAVMMPISFLFMYAGFKKVN